MQDQVWWVTGASSGIGAALARALAGRGARLILSGRNVAALEAVAKDCGPGTMILPFEATDYAALPLMAEEAWNWCGRIDGLVNNAGISQRSLAIETDFSVYQKIVDVDLLAPIALTQQLLPRMVAAGGGQIVAISSVAGIAGVPLRSAYCAAKHGLIGYHDSIRAENEHLGLRVLVVAPGSIATNVSRNALNADGSVRGESDKAIDNGLSPDFAAAEIIAAVDAGTRELVVAEGAEAAIPGLRRSDPDALFDRMSAMVQAGYAAQMAAARAT
ncbi:MAG: short-chain dehydrogenase [Sphingopyxis sp. RIFCSPHIGHO2_01_FULL_65_24]|nr:MAG: short-chain dehydrogenase [Sphingopyxis sp. RIFCSPHIGHO2_01_FULL_65_24]